MAVVKARKRNIYLDVESRFATLEERMAAGQALRKRVPRSSHGLWSEWSERPDPIALLVEQNKTRVPELIPIRWARMLESPFVFMRASARVMAADLASTPNTGIRVQACGDAHLLNFGGFATPERNLVFDINDFDETLPAPWEWDVKRLVASVEIAGRDRLFSAATRADLVRATSESYRSNMVRAAELTALQTWYAKFDVKTNIRLYGDTPRARREMRQAEKEARRRTYESAIIKMTDVTNGRRRIIDNPPLIFHLAEKKGHPGLNAVMSQYRETLRDDLRVLFDRYHVVDMAFKVVGVGSVGTRCAIALMMANDGDAFFLQMKEANRSVLDVYAGRSKYRNHGQRVVVGQRIMQSASDTFLGWTSLDGRDYYIRQLRDMKWSLDPATASAQRLMRWARGCAATLARAHARSADPAVIAGYLGSKNTFDDAMVQFASAYADQTERDFERLKDAAKKKRITVARGGEKALSKAIMQRTRGELN